MPGRTRPRRKGAARRPAPPPLTIVGVGASAGGLEALEQFFAAVPRASGLAFVVLQHLDPTRPGLLPELLQRSTAMEVLAASDRARVQADHVYVIPPNAELTIRRGLLHLSKPVAPRGHRLPIDLFFDALAKDSGPRGAGVILSGMGSDGTQGIAAIKARGGLVLVQDPATAAFDAMPRSALATGLADGVAAAGELPARLLALVRGPSQGGAAPRKARGSLEAIAAILRTRTGHDFSLYKKSTLQRRVDRRLAVHHLRGLPSYVRLLEENPQEQRLLFDELLIGVTGFFREPAAWDALRDRVFPALFERHAGAGQLRAWCVGCSTGEEAYSLGIVFKEALERTRPRAACSLQIFATDLQAAAIDQARQGVYPSTIAAAVGPERLRRFFVEEGSGRYRVAKEIRDLVILAPQDVIRDPPFTKLDLVVCRNLLIYLEPALQARLLPMFHYGLRPGGALFLGNSETVGGRTDLFAPAAEARLRIYQRRTSGARLEPAAFPSSFLPAGDTSAREPATLRPAEGQLRLAEQAVQRLLCPPAVLVNELGDILWFSGGTGPYLEPSGGKTDWNVFSMARDGLRAELAAAVRTAVRKGRPVMLAGARLRQGGRRSVDVSVHPLTDPEPLRGLLLVAFVESARPAEAGSPRGAAPSARERGRLAAVEQELGQVTAELRATREEMRASQEELRSSNEELQSTNEELQSTNEELTTSKEELQSMNEELQTVNGELQAKLEELSRTNNDLKNLLDATDIATVFLDRNLAIRRFTAQATRLVRLIPGDVGRPVTDISSDLLHRGLAADVEEVLRTLAVRERQLRTAAGRWFTVRVMPYRTLDDVIDGAVITMVDITVAKVLEAELRRSRDRFAALLSRLPPALSVVDAAGRRVPAAAVPERIAAEDEPGFAGWRIVAGRGAPG